VPKGKIIIQSFLPGNLDAAAKKMPGVALSILTTKGNEIAGLTIAGNNGYKWVSPAWPVSAAFITQAHGAGKLVVPYTLDKASEVRAANNAGVDAVITDDPAMARKAVGLTAPPK
jgi:glycerophosphoryl diester phosphodiesterase